MPKKERFCKLLREAITDEKKAEAEYARLKSAANTVLPTMAKSGAPVLKRFKTLIDEVVDDEAKHKEKLSRYFGVYCK